ncbi:HAD-IC family P-type ATPase [Actinophytocola sp. NPDC049390]|uniref:HAD-IC family P-type ATPase n=1 Tax=Actinophytocola sp. NPDC049390 TaxID=3363894 RepID=UPI0037A3F41B
MLRDHELAGVLAISDVVRVEAAPAVAAVTRLTGAEPVLLTGDNAATARQVAAQVGITDVRAGLLPDDKVTAVRDLEAAGQRVAVVGDGINDAPPRSPLPTPGSPWAVRAPTSPCTPRTRSSSATT